MSQKVIAAGHICLDMTPVLEKKSPGGLNELFAPGKLLQVESAEVHTGGSVANTGLAMKLFGADVRLVGKTGCDAFGDIVAGILDRYSAADGLIRDQDSSTSYSIVIAPPGIDRIFLHHPGANDTFSCEDVTDAMLRGAALFHFGYPPLMRRMYQNGGEELARLFRRSKESGAATSLDMAAVDPDSEAGRADWTEILKNVLPYVDFFLPSAEELCFMLDRARYAGWLRRAGNGRVTDALDIRTDVVPLAELALGMGAKFVLVKCGALGMYYRASGEKALRKIGSGVPLDFAAWAGRSGFERSFRVEQVLSGTGAGDTSIAAFLVSALEGCPVEKCVTRAVATGSCCIEAYDALSGLKPLPELDRHIAAGWEREKTKKEEIFCAGKPE